MEKELEAELAKAAERFNTDMRGDVRMTVTTHDPDANLFPYSLSDLVGWAIKHKDGSITKFTLGEKPSVVKKGGKIEEFPSNPPQGTVWTKMSDFCNHAPALLPTFSSGNLHLFIADAVGVKAHKDEFDLVIDCGHVLALSDIFTQDSLLSGDEDLCDVLDQYTTIKPMTWPRLLKIDWADRKAPMVKPEFWVALAQELAILSKRPDPFDVVINCQGGHGRSGTAMVCLMMVLNPEYGAGAAITHLRAIHCARAIESIEQHNYIDEVAKFLGQEPDSKTARAITDYHAGFKALKIPSAKKYQERLK